MYKVSQIYWFSLLAYVPLLLIYLFMIVVFATGSSTTGEFPQLVILFAGIVAIHILLLGLFAFIQRKKITLGVGILNLILLGISVMGTFLNLLKMELDVTGLILHGIVMLAGMVLAVETFIKLKLSFFPGKS